MVFVVVVVCVCNLSMHNLAEASGISTICVLFGCLVGLAHRGKTTPK